MADGGVYVGDLDSASVLDEVLGTYQGDAARMGFDDFVAFIVGQASVTITGATAYPTPAAGLAASAEGQYFSVAPGTSNPDVAFIIYREVSGAAVEITRISSSALVAAINSRLSSAEASVTTLAAKLAGVEAGADVTDGDNVASAIAGRASKATPVDADSIALIDAASGILRRLTWANAKATLKTYFDTVYQAAIPGLQTQLDTVALRTAPLVDYPADASVRPGKNPALVTADLTGRASTTVPYTSAAVVATTYGEAIEGLGPFRVARRDPFAIIDSHIYRVTFVIAAVTNPADPGGDSMQLALHWLNGAYNAIATRVVENKSLVVADGLYVKTVVMSKVGAEGAGGLDILIPATARHFRAFVESFSATARRQVHIIAIEDVTNAQVAAGDVSALTGRVTTTEDAITTLKGRTVSAGGLATGGGDLTANRTITVPKATSADMDAAAANPGTANDTKAATPLSLATALAGLLGLTTVIDASTVGYRIRGALTRVSAIAVDPLGVVSMAGARWKASITRAVNYSDGRGYRIFSISREGRRIRIGSVVFERSLNPGSAFRLLDSRGNAGFVLARGGAMRAAGFAATGSGATTVYDAQPAMGPDLYLGTKPLPLYVANLLASRADAQQVVATLSSYGAPGGEVYAPEGSRTITIDPAKITTATAKLTLRPLNGAPDLRYEQILNVFKPIVSTASPKILSIGDSLTEGGLMDTVGIRLVAAGRTPTWLGTIRSGAYNAATSADVGGQLGEARSGRMLAQLTYRIANSDVLPVEAGDEAAYTGGTKPYRILRNPFLKLDDGSQPARVQNGYFFSPAFYQSRGFIASAPDIVIIGLGTNDWRSITGTALTNRLALDLALVISAIRADWPAALILLWLPSFPRSAIRDGVWAEGPRRVEQAFIKFVRNLADSKVKLVSTWAHMSQEIGYPLVSNTPNADTGTAISTLDDSIHPEGVEGLVRAQIADTLANAITHYV